LVFVRALKATVSASAQGCFSLLVAAVIAALTAVRAASAAPEADVVTGNALAHLDFEVSAALNTVRFNVSNTFTGQGHLFHLLSKRKNHPPSLANGSRRKFGTGVFSLQRHKMLLLILLRSILLGYIFPGTAATI
jgi:hypothetical protein